MPNFLMGPKEESLQTPNMGNEKMVEMVEQQLPFVEVGGAMDWTEIEDKVRALEENGEREEALRIANLGVQEARSNQNGKNKSTGRLLHCLTVRAELFGRLDKLSEAKDDYLEAISLIAGEPRQEAMLGRLYGSLGYLFELMEKPSEAADAYERALEQLGRLRIPAVLEEVRLSNNLAFLYSAKDDFDQAETLFLKALKMAHESLGPSDPDTTGVCNNVGALYQKAGHLEQAREMHLMALEGRKKDGSSLADLAQSHGNLAIVFAEEGKEQESREHFEAALKAFQKTGPEAQEDFMAVAENYLQLLSNVGDKEGEARVKALLAKGL